MPLIRAVAAATPAAAVTSQLLAPNAMRARAKAGFFASTAGGTAIAPITAWPTTTGTFVLYNGDGSATYDLDSLGVFLVSGTPAAGVELLVCVTPLTAAPTAYSGSIVGSLSGLGQASSKAVVGNAVTITNTGWTVVGRSDSGAVATIAGSGVHARIDGRISLPPGYALATAALSGAGTSPLFGYYWNWDEVQ